MLSAARLAAALVALLAFVQLLDWTGATLRLDRLVHDAWVRLGEREPPPDVLIAAIDGPSLAELGRWPWSRDLQSVVLTRIAELGARAVLVDVVYAEPSADRGSDARLSAALEALPTVILPVVLEDVRGRAPRDLLPVVQVMRAADALGHVGLPIDDDGIVRRAFLRAGIGAPHWSAFALAAHESLGNLDPGRLPGRRIEPEEQGRNAPRRRALDHEVLIPYYGPAGTFERVSVVDIVAGRVEPADVEGRTVLLGLTAFGLGDSVPAPVSALDAPLPGVEAHATLYAALADDSLVVPAPRWTGLAVDALLLPVLLLLYSRARPELGLVLALAAAAVPFALSGALYGFADRWYAPVGASLAVLASHLLWSRYRLAYVNRFLEAEREKLARQIPERGGPPNERLAAFFETASRHLPIDGWRFTADGERYGGGVSVPALPIDAGTRGWRRRGAVHARHFPGAGHLEIALLVADPELATDLTRYIDSLDRVRSRDRPSAFAGTVERLQRNAQQLARQIVRLGGIKTFSETLLSGAPLGFAIWTPAGELVRDNPLVHALVPGLPTRTPLSDFLAALGHDPADDAAARERLDALLRRGDSWQIVRERGEQEIVVDLTAVGPSLSQRLVCASIVDVSDLRRVERARAELVEFLGHDLRSPLISALYLVEDEGTDDDSRRIAANIRKSLGMMEDLLHVARADALDEAGFAEVLLDDVVGNALDLLVPQARGRRVRLVRVGEWDELWVLGDAASLERAVANLVGNAVKYSHEGGEVRVSLERQPGPDGTGGAGRAVLRVADDGVGIDPAVIDTLFTRFKRDARIVRSHEGIGLGLALVARVVSQHGGTVHAFSEGHGTEIRLELPAVRVDD